MATDSADLDSSSFAERYPAFARLVMRDEIPFVPQMTSTDCGAACLAMVLAHFGRSVRIDELREATGARRDGTNARAILDAGRRHGLQGRGLRVEVDALDCLDGTAAILHWNLEHFVVLERVRKHGIDVVDPASGRRFVSFDEVRRSFTGIALVLEPAPDFVATPKEKGILWSYTQAVLRQTRLLPRILWMTAFVQLFGLAVPLLTGAIVDGVIPRSDSHLLTVLLVASLSVMVFQLLASLVRGHLLLHLRTALDSRLTLGFFEHLVRLPYQYFQLRSTGDLLMRLNSNSSVREILTSTILSGLLDGSMVCFYLILLLWLSPPLAGVVLALAVVEIALFLGTRRLRRELSLRSLEAQARSRNEQIQIVNGMETLKALGSEQRAVDRWSSLFVDELNASLASGRLDAWLNSLFGAMRMIGPVLVLVFGAWQVLAGRISLGEMLALNATAVGLLTPLSTLVGNATQLQLLESYAQRIEDVLRAEAEEDDTAARRPHALRGAVELDNVRFAYGPGSPEVVRGVSVRIEPGQHVAIVGRSGAGKSTLAGLLIGLYRPQVGSVRFDGVKLEELALRPLRSQVGVVTQQAFLFGASVRDNILLGRDDLELDDVRAAARLAGIDHQIESWPMGYDTLISDAGASLSGGQRQRIALARALVARPALVLLDEATSALDALTERDVQAALDGLRCTRIVIAHRLSTIVNADLILVLDDGALVEQGTHSELLLRGGAYARLVASQLGSNPRDATC